MALILQAFNTHRSGPSYSYLPGALPSPPATQEQRRESVDESQVYLYQKQDIRPPVGTPANHHITSPRHCPGCKFFLETRAMPFIVNTSDHAKPQGERTSSGSGDPPETRSVCSSRSSSSGGGERRAGLPHQHHQPICKICFQGAEQGELLNPCRCDGSVRYTHQLCLLKWISERGSWTCELCCYRYHVIAIKMKQPCQWQSISITLVEKVQMIAVILGSLFLIASVTWLLWSAFSPYAVWQRKDILFQICYGMYGFMDLVCIGLIVHEGAAVYRVFKRWRAVNLHWDVLNYDKATDIEESSRGESSTSRTLWLPLTALRNRNLVHPTQLTSPRFQCGYVLLHLFNRMRPREDLSEDNSSGEVVMRVTSV
ncbi:E3 ubiquitin-protein ligase MARCHF11 [Vulpes lagopus]|uniref:E3 ubiquitin-protein ligase MARCHF11 n=1 Tax=Vulpes lagopus TaxID=494514 RepID=UPI001BCA452C|nr:E3 ubiquitin-protein ligase MARCHF11 [Vulpes lagopus]